MPCCRRNFQPSWLLLSRVQRIVSDLVIEFRSVRRRGAYSDLLNNLFTMYFGAHPLSISPLLGGRTMVLITDTPSSFFVFGSVFTLLLFSPARVWGAGRRIRRKKFVPRDRSRAFLSGCLQIQFY